MHDAQIVGTSLEDLDNEQFVELAREACEEFGKGDHHRRALGAASPTCSATCRSRPGPRRWPRP